MFREDYISCPRGTTYDDTGCLGGQVISGPRGPLMGETVRWMTGPSYTYQSGEIKTTIDYVTLDIGAASLMESCGTIQDDDLNTSDHS